MKSGREHIADPVCQIATRMRALGIAVSILEEDAARLSLPHELVTTVPTREALFSTCDVVAAIGGDGTIFHAASDAMFYDKPVLGINAGRLGFLAQIEADELSSLSELAEGRYTIEERLVLQAELHRADGSVSTVYAANDIVFSRPDFGRVFDIEVCCGSDLVGVYRADGIIFATPTGSTAYSLSAGGPIADPTVDCMIMTPLASHSLVSRSIVFSGDQVLSAHSPDSGTDAFYLVADGKTFDAVAQDDVVTIRKASYKTRFVCLQGRSFYHILNEKMKRRG
jgi:NAD+ kinase